MSSTYLSLHYHVIFSTKNRAPFIDVEWRDELHRYMGGVVNGLDGTSLCVGGVEDHVHLLFGLKSTHCLSDFMRELKKSSSNWTADIPNMESFHWQNGYAAFTVSPIARDGVRKYVLNQDEHHRRRTFREELIELLEMAGIEYDERYLD